MIDAGTRALDRLTGRMTMYRLVTVLLALIAVVAVVLSLLGQLPFAPVELAASAAVAVGSTLIASRVLALIFRTRPHTESSIITGLLLFFLFWPSTLLPDLATLALAGTLATASKYLIVWRGRHILNPAAAGATLVAVFQLNSAVWWVASEALLPFTLIGALLVLHRTRRLPMGALFVIVSGGILVSRLSMGGQGFGDALSTTFASYPVLFFAGFMLTEPLTLPPRRWQQLVLAVIVGVLFTVPFSVPPVFLSFEFALVVGNVLAFLVGQRRGIRLHYLGSRQLTPTAREFRFRPQRPVTFRAGQYLELTLPHRAPDIRGSRRIFTIASPPGDEIAVGLRMTQPPSSFKRALLDLAPGALVHATSVGGDFVLPRDPAKPVLLIAAGIGITPFLSQLADDRAAGRRRDSVLLYAVSSLEELAYFDELAGLDGLAVLLVAPTAPAALPASWRWIGPGPISAQLVRDSVPDAASRAVYVSGSPANVSTARAALREVGVRHVVTDYFTGY